jgi:predicted anti-sigma-YlaC factor YlaD
VSVSGADGLTCRSIRQLLGVYVVGAIDPGERSVVDEHLSQCPACRDELAGLAGLPAMLSRVPLAEAERIAVGTMPPESEAPPVDLLNSLLRKVWARRRARMWRSVAAVAAAAVIAAGSATAAVELAGPSTLVASATSASTHVGAVVDYSAASWGTAMRVRVSGVSPGTFCQFWVVGQHGRVLAGSWMVGYSYNEDRLYSASAAVGTGAIRDFVLTSGGKVLVSVPT